MNTQEYWDKNYMKITEGDGTINVNLRKIRTILKYLLGYNFEELNILEIGSGMGLMAFYVAHLNGGNLNYIGLDISDVGMDVAKRASRKIETVKYVQTDLTKIWPVPDKFFSCVWAFDVLEHMPVESRTFIYSEINRVLKIHGRIMINNPLKKTLHDPNFDFGWDTTDLSCMCSTAKIIIDLVERYEIYPYMARDINNIKLIPYQFIVGTKYD